jgi:hypothetical protein
LSSCIARTSFLSTESFSALDVSARETTYTASEH